MTINISGIGAGSNTGAGVVPVRGGENINPRDTLIRAGHVVKWL